MQTVTNDFVKKWTLDAAPPAGVVIGKYEDQTPAVLKIPFPVHMLIAGQTGAGKSGWLTAIERQTAGIQAIQTVKIDLKFGIEAERWMPRLSGAATSPAEATKLLNDVVLLMEKRSGFLKSVGKREWSLKYGPQIVVIVDEAASLGDVETARDNVANLLAALDDPDPTVKSMSAKQSEAEAKLQKALAAARMSMTKDLVKKARALGICMILATQQPLVSSLGGDSTVRSQLGGRLVGAMEDATGFSMALGDGHDLSQEDYGRLSGADGKPVAGAAYARRILAPAGQDPKPVHFVQSMHFDKDEAAVGSVIEQTAHLAKPLSYWIDHVDNLALVV